LNDGKSQGRGRTAAVNHLHIDMNLKLRL
jgi:hypothetical protein